MKELASTRMSSRGQVVIPEEIRKSLNLQTGTQFVVFCEKDVVIFKIISAPSMDEFDYLIRQARAKARKAGLGKADVKSATLKARKGQ
jgi:AbrB family looped-hinge helix DNA binding protein